jgi:hypothetical protein
VLCAPGVSRADDNHEVINVVNNLVYVSLGTRDGAEVGDEIEVLSNGAPLGKIELDLCGEVICRGKLPKSLSTKVLRGMPVRLVDSGPSPAPGPSPVPAPPVAKPVPTTFAPSPAPTYSPPSSDLPERISYREPIPVGYRVERQRIKTAVTLGWIGLSTTYGISLLAGIGGDSAMIIPVIGPFVRAADNKNGESNTTYLLLGLGQTISLVFLIAGYAGERVLVRTSGVTVSVGGSGIVGRF